MVKWVCPRFAWPEWCSAKVRQAFSEAAAFAWSLCSQSSCDRFVTRATQLLLNFRACTIATVLSLLYLFLACSLHAYSILTNCFRWSNSFHVKSSSDKSDPFYRHLLDLLQYIWRNRWQHSNHIHHIVSEQYTVDIDWEKDSNATLLTDQLQDQDPFLALACYVRS